MRLSLHDVLQATRVHLGLSIAPPPTQIIVAAVLERHGRFLFVEEMVNGVLCLNQPSGRLEIGESVANGAVRETWEEAGVRFTPTSLVGIYDWYSPKSKNRYLRFAFTGTVIDWGDGRPHDPAIQKVSWLNRTELAEQKARHRSPFVFACVDDFLAGTRYPLGVVTQI